jgi:hypothetical protein
MVETIPDFVATKRYGNSLAALKKRYPEECPTHIIAQALEIPEEQVEMRYQQVVANLKALMGA